MAAVVALAAAALLARR
ncbi:hypothetical protein [Halobacterium sp. CBA1126]